LSTTPSKTQVPYLHLLDYVRVACMLAIITFHSTEFIFYDQWRPIYSSTWIYKFFHHYARLYPYAGHTIILISFFLIGYTKKIYKKLPLWLILFALAHISISFVFSSHQSLALKNFEWDIYPFLILSLSLIHVLSKRDKLPWGMISIICFSFLCLPIELFHFDVENPLLRMIFFGTCLGTPVGAWPIFPWIFLPLGSFALGNYCHTHVDRLSNFKRKEQIVWALLTVTAFSGYCHYHLPASDNFSISSGFYCFVLRQDPLSFWSSFFFSIFFLRLSLLNGLNSFIKSWRLTQFMARSSWNKSFGITYILQIALLSLGSTLENIFVLLPQLFDLYFVLLFFGSDYLARWILDIIKKYTNERKDQISKT
jgi:hypothetical protein